MKKIELLSPAGDMECLKMAVLCGADAVYISGKEYGARAYATNFTLEEINEAVKFCHLYGVRLYVTVNTLINDEFLDDCISYIEKLYKMGVDALIMQDIGLMMLVHERIPSFEIHASTQVHNSNNDSLKYLKSIGCTRSVLAREMSVSDIKEIDTDIELEVFIHGALCVCYSGCCLMSSRLFGRSGNKGACAGPCRFCYDLYNDDDNRHLADPMPQIHNLQHAETVHFRHIDVKHHEVDILVFFEDIDGFCAVFRHDIFVFIAEYFLKEHLVHFRIVRDEYFFL